MLGRDVIKEIKRTREPGQQFISWWRKEQDFLDFDLIDRFIENCTDTEVIDGFDLLGIDAMWNRLMTVVPDRVKLETMGGQKLVLWQKEDGKEVQCPFAPEVLMDIFDTETKDSYID
jgi:hypothetical protein